MTDVRLPDASGVDDSWQRYRAVEDDVAEVVYETDTAGVIRWISSSVQESLGWTPEQLLGTPARDLIHPADLDRINALRTSLYEDRQVQVDVPCLFLMADSAYRAMTVRARPLVGTEDDVIGAIVRLTDSHDRDAALRALTTLSRATRIVVRAMDEQTLLQQMCETIITSGRYLYCWYGRPVDDAQQSVQPIAEAGRGDGYLDEVHISWGDNEHGHGPTGTSIRLQETRIANDPVSDPTFAPWIVPASKRGFRSSISLPVMVDGQLDGVLVVYAHETDAFNALAKDLLEDLAADLGYGLQQLRIVRDRDVVLRKLTDSERRFRLLGENSSDVILLSKRDMTVTWASPSAESVFGYPPEAVVGHNAGFLIHPEDLPMVVAEVMRTDADQSNLHVRHRLIHADGHVFWVDVAAGHIDDDGTGEPGRVVSIREIDAEVRAEQELAAREQQYRLLAENASDIVWQTGANGTVAWASPSITTILGWQTSEVIGRRGMEFVHPDDVDRVLADREEAMHNRPTLSTYRVLAKDGTSRWMSVSIRSVPDPPDTRIITMRDVQDEVVARQQLEHALGHDQLTGLPVRRIMLQRIADRQSELNRYHVVGVLCIGIDGLSEVNEALTHTAGDLLLTTVAARVASAVPDAENLGRASGNELVVIAPDLRNGGDAGALAETLRIAVHGATTIAGQQVAPTISVGIAIGGSTADAEQLLRDASLALRKAKENGRDRFEFADPGLAIEAQHRLSLDNEIREAVARDAFVPWFQPIVNLSTGAVVGYESLVRWVRASGVGQPLSFIPIAERSSLITDIDIAVLAKSVAALTRLPESAFVAVNVSASTLGRGGYAEEATRALARASIDPGRLHIEVTETMLLDPSETVVDTIHRLANLGVKWYIDDFGTGYASITSLRDLPMHGLKLDRSFTYGISSHDRTSTQLAEALVGLAQGLGLDTVAEGVETREQATYLASLGWHHGQGWLFGRPEPL